MLEFIYKILDFFSPYANPFEKKIDKFLSGLTPQSNRSATEKDILGLMQENLVIFDLWTERRYKGYLYLHKKKRRELYENTKAIRRNLDEYINQNHVQIEEIFGQIKSQNVKIHHLRGYENELKYLFGIMNYFAPENGRFVYRESSNFGGLLQDPGKEKLVGDCNQIVTLYAYFFSLKFRISELSIKTLPGHVCLHFRGIDIEATAGAFARHEDEKQKILSIAELMAVNLLDTTDSYAKTHPITPHAFLESAKLAFLLSSEKEIVENNLSAAYQKMVNTMMDEKRFDLALTYARQSADEDLIKYTANNSAIYYLNQNQFPKAYEFARHALDPKLDRAIEEAEGVYCLNHQQFDKAIYIFQKIGNSELVRKCYAAKAIKLQDQLKGVKTVDDLRKRRSVLYKMRDYARQSGDSGLIEHVEGMLRQI